MNHKHDMMVRLHNLHYDIWHSLDDSYSIKSSEMYRVMMATNRLILRSAQRYNGNHKL